MARIEFNPFPLPLIQFEECWSSPLILEGFEYDWKQSATTSDRLYYHHTLSSIRQHKDLKQKCAPKDSLDLVLASVYDQSEDAFRDKFFVMTQPETVGLPTYRLLKNKRLIPAQRPARDLIMDEEIRSRRESDSLLPGTTWHGIRQGGVTEKRNVHHIKLGIASGNNRGYSRKNDGTFYSS
ncbi:uncharacterized protein C1orf194 homolog [Cimex lectularius]|uniref:Uncharacterized protein n=1 Tax=Cimex lectularius TaxID=79782 RepID=A0A8I6TB94_CIMLE|nr:uncharacterized protein C1orf194 homolog [Cimex lectularius]